MNKNNFFLVLTDMNKSLATQLTFLIFSNKNIQTYLHKDFRGRLFLAHTKIQRTYLYTMELKPHSDTIYNLFFTRW